MAFALPQKKKIHLSIYYISSFSFIKYSYFSTHTKMFLLEPRQWNFCEFLCVDTFQVVPIKWLLGWTLTFPFYSIARIIFIQQISGICCICLLDNWDSKMCNSCFCLQGNLNICIYQLTHLINTHWIWQAVRSTMGTLQRQQRLLRVPWFNWCVRIL